MGVNAVSQAIQTSKPTEALRRLGSCIARVSTPSGLLAFASGPLAARLLTLAEQFRSAHPHVPALFASSDGVFTEQGELEHQDGLVCLTLAGKPLSVSLHDDLQDALGIGVSDSALGMDARRAVPRLVMASSQLGSPRREHFEVSAGSKALGWFGAVTSSEGTLVGVDHKGSVQVGSVACVGFPGLENPLLAAAPCCRLITEPLRVSRCEGNTVFELEGVPALVTLGQASAKLADCSWIVVALAESGNLVPTLNDGAPNVLLRPVRGVDPERGAIVLADPIAAQTRLAFAVRDDRAARRSLEDALRSAKARLCGGSPRFGFYFDGLGRGRSLYGAANVDVGLLKQAFGEFPLIGMRSAFELRGDLGMLGAQTLTGQLSLFRNAS
jgi:small ligand-binding sensory domain FIST